MGQSVLPPTPPVGYNRVVFLSSGTFTLPKTAYNKFDCILVSGGGGGARQATSPQKTTGGFGVFGYYQEVFCTNETTLTITVGGGGAGATSVGNNGADGTASTITGIAGNGVSTSLSSGTASGGRIFTAGQFSTSIADSISIAFTGYGNYSNFRGGAVGWGAGSFSMSPGTGRYAMAARNLFSNIISRQPTNSVGQSAYMRSPNVGGPIPLLGSLLHASPGTSGTNSGGTGGVSTPDTFFSGGGGGSYYIETGRPGVGGGGGAGGVSSSGGTTSGTGGNGSANSGGGGGAAGRNSASNTNTGNGGNGGSGFVIIGYWG
jgi:hypothetical protein